MISVKCTKKKFKKKKGKEKKENILGLTGERKNKDVFLISEE